VDEPGVTDVSDVVFVEVSEVDKLVVSNVDIDVELIEFDVELIRVEVVLVEVTEVDDFLDDEDDVSELTDVVPDTVV